MKLSIGMMVKNEEKYLEQCLNSLTPILDNVDSELIIVDTGSTDRTVEIAKKFTDKIYFHKWNNDFSEMRNLTINYCSGEWFFCIDGDEIIEECNEIITFINSGEYKKYKSAIVNIKNLADLNDDTNYIVYTGLRLFEKDEDFKFIGTIHNQPLYKEPIKRLNVNIQHFGYVTTDKDLMEKKFKRTSELLKKELEKNPGNVYYMYQLSVSYSMHGDKKQAVTEIERAYSFIKDNKINICDHLYVLQQLCVCYLNTNNYFQIVKYASEWLSYKDDVIDVYYYLGYSQLMLSIDKEAINNLEMYVELVENNNDCIVDIRNINYTIGKINDVYYYLYLLYSKITDNEKALYYLLKINNSKYNILQELVTFCIKNKYYKGLYECYRSFFRAEDNDKIKDLLLYIEKGKMKLDKIECNEITKLLTNNGSLYAKLNKIRISYENKNNDFVEEIKEFINNNGMGDLPEYFGDIVYYIIDFKENLSEILSDVDQKVCDSYIKYISIKYEDFSDKVYEYLEIYGDKEDFKSLRINKELYRYLLLLSKLDRKNFQHAFLKYIDIGIKYINIVYTPFIFDNERYQECKDEEDGFFIFMRKAKQYEKSDKKLYLRYLSKALKIYPNMKDGVKLLLDKVKYDSNIQNDEMAQYKIQVKNTVKLLIDSGKIEDAEKIMNEYEEIVSDDIEILLFKSQIFLKGKC